MTWARDTLGAVGRYDAGWRATGTHTRLALTAGVATPLTQPEEASHILIQAENQNVRICMVGTASATVGYTLTAAAAPIAVSVIGGNVSVFPIAAGAVIQYTWIW